MVEIGKGAGLSRVLSEVHVAIWAGEIGGRSGKSM